MIKVKLFRIAGFNCEYCDRNYDFDPASEWSEIEEGDYSYLCQWARKNGVIVVYQVKEFENVMLDVRKIAEKERIEIQKQKAAEEARKAKLLERKLAKEQKSKRELLEQLKKEFGEV